MNSLVKTIKKFIEKFRCSRDALTNLYDKSEGEFKEYLGEFIQVLNNALNDFETCNQISSQSEQSE